MPSSVLFGDAHRARRLGRQDCLLCVGVSSGPERGRVARAELRGSRIEQGRRGTPDTTAVVSRGGRRGERRVGSGRCSCRHSCVLLSLLLKQWQLELLRSSLLRGRCRRPHERRVARAARLRRRGRSCEAGRVFREGRLRVPPTQIGRHLSDGSTERGWLWGVAASAVQQWRKSAL